MKSTFTEGTYPIPPALSIRNFSLLLCDNWKSGHSYEVGLFYFFATLTFFHRAFCAAEILFLAAADIFRRAPTFVFPPSNRKT